MAADAAVSAGIAAAEVAASIVAPVPSRLSQKDRASTSSGCGCIVASVMRKGTLHPAWVPAPNLTRNTTPTLRRLCEDEQSGGALDLRSPSF